MAEASVPYVCMSHVPCPCVPMPPCFQDHTSPRPLYPRALISLCPCGSTFLMSACSHSSCPHNLHISVFFMSLYPSHPRVPVFPCLHIPMSPCPHAPYLHILHVSMSSFPIFSCRVPVSSCLHVPMSSGSHVHLSSHPHVSMTSTSHAHVPKCPYPHVLYVLLSCPHVYMSPYPSCPQVPYPHVFIPP